AEIGDHRRDGVGAGPLEGVDNHQQLDEVVVNRMAGGLNNKSVATADAFLNLYVGFPVAEILDLNLAELGAQITGDFLGELRVGPTGKNLHLAGVMNAAFNFQF